MLTDRLAKVNSTSRNAFLGALILIATMAMYNQILGPRAAYLFAVQQQEFVLSSIAEKRETVGESIETKKQELEELKDRLTEMQSILLTGREAKEFLSDLQVIATECGCVVNSLNVTQHSGRGKGRSRGDEAGIEVRSAELNIVGAYDNIIALVTRLQARSRKVWIDSLSIEDVDNDSSQLKGEIIITIYVVPDKETNRNE